MSNKEREKERFQNCYKFQECIGRFTYATFYFNEQFSNKEAQKIGEKINDLCDQIHDLINDLCLYDED